MMKHFLMMALLLPAISQGLEKKYYQCSTKVLKELQLPYKSHFEVNEYNRDVGYYVENDILKIFNLKNLENIESYDVSSFYVQSVHFSFDNRFILVNPMRKNIHSILIDRQNGQSKEIMAQDYEWLSDNLLGKQDYSESQTRFFVINPLTLEERQLPTPNLKHFYWQNFLSSDSDLTANDSNGKITVYSLSTQKEKTYDFTGRVLHFDLKNNFALTSSQNIYKLIRLSDMKELAEMATDKNFSYDIVGPTIFLQDNYGYINTDGPDRRNYQRIAVNILTGEKKDLSYIGPWQSLNKVDDHFLKLQVIDTIARDENNIAYYSIRDNNWNEILRVQSPTNGFTVLQNLYLSKLFTIIPSSSYDSGAKYKGVVGLFNLSDIDRINYHFFGDESFNEYTTYSPTSDRLITTVRESSETQTGEVIKLWQLNLNCSPTDYKF